MGDGALVIARDTAKACSRKRFTRLDDSDFTLSQNSVVRLGFVFDDTDNAIVVAAVNALASLGLRWNWVNGCNV